MRINPNTKDALLFMTGLMGMVAQGVLAAFGVQPSLPLIGAYLAMCGIASASSILGIGSGQERDFRDDNHDEPPSRKGTESSDASGRVDDS